MSIDRRKFIWSVSIGGLAALAPSFTTRLLPPSKSKLGLVNHVVVHLPTGQTSAHANEDVSLWTNLEAYHETLARFQADGRLLHFSILTDEATIRVQLHFATTEDRQQLVEALDDASVFDDTKRIELGYRISEYVQLDFVDGISQKTEMIRHLA